MSLTDRLLESSPNMDTYNPYENPPNIQRAEQHQRANKVGLSLEDDNIKQCSCCGNAIQKRDIDILCEEDNLLFLGVGYPLYFKLFKYFGAVILIVFIVSGSGFLLLTALSCQQNCVYFLQVPILNIDSNHKTSFLFDLIHLVTSVVILALTLFVKIRIENDIYFLESKSISPEQYTIIVQNLPEEVNEDQITEWSKQKFGIKPIIINFAYNLSQLQDAFEQRLLLTIRMNRMAIKKRELEKQKEENMKNLLAEYIKDMEEKILKYDRIIDHYKHENVNCRKIGTVFLTYSEQKNVSDILNKYETNFLNTILNNSLSSFRNKSVKYNGIPVVIRKAPAPREIIWENLSFSYVRYIITELLALITMILVLFVAFKIQLYFAEIEYEYRLDHQQELGDSNIIMDFLESFSLSTMIMLVNLLLRLIIQTFINMKRHYSYSRYQSSFCFYYSLMYIFNTCFMIYIIHMRHRPSDGSKAPDQPQLPTLGRDYILLYDIHILMLINCMSDPIYKIIDPYMWVRILRRRYIAALPPEMNPYTQAYINELWEDHSISNVDNYQYVFRVLVVSVWFAHAAPLGVLISLFAYFADYWITKYMLLRWYKKPETISKRIAVPFIKSLPLIPLVYLCGVLQYVYKVSDSHNLFAFIFNFLDYAAVILITIFIVVAYYRLKVPPRQAPDPTRYDEVEIAFEDNYDTENPMNKIKSNIKYAAYRDLKRSTLKSSSKILSDIMMLSKKQSVSERQSEIMKIKKKKLKKLQTIEIELMQEKVGRMKNHNSYREKSSSDSSIED